MGDPFPSLRGRQMRKILTRLCGKPLPGGKHPRFRSPKTGQLFSYGYHDQREIRPGMVQRILVSDVGLSVDEARKETR